MTYTYVALDLSESAYEEIKSKLLAAGYNHAIDANEDLIDMNGLAVAKIRAERQDMASNSTNIGIDQTT